MDTVKVIYKGFDSVNFRCPGVFKANVKPGDIIEGIPADVYERDIKNDDRYSLVSEKTSVKGKSINKMEQQSESEEK